MGLHTDALGTAAIAVLASEGSRAFTHRAVDRRAGLPEGTASRYARTRTALLELAGEALFVEDRRQVLGALARDGASTPDAAALSVLLVPATKALLAAPERYRARVELQLESARTTALRQNYHRTRRAFVDPLADMLTATGHPRPRHTADLLITTIDAILHRQIVIGEPPLSDRRLRDLFAAILDAPDAVPMSRPTPP